MVIWWLQNLNSVSAQIPMLIKIIFSSLLLFLQFSAVYAEVYSNKICDFEVAFPKEPQRYATSTAMGDHDAAELNIDGSFLRAECFPNMYNDSIEHETLSKQILLDYAAANGLSQPTVTIYDHDGYFIAELRGYKQFDGNQAIYEMITYWTDSSVLFLLVASGAERFPTQEILAFISSVKMR